MPFPIQLTYLDLKRKHNQSMDVIGFSLSVLAIRKQHIPDTGLSGQPVLSKSPARPPRRLRAVEADLRLAARCLI